MTTLRRHLGTHDVPTSSQHDTFGTADDSAAHPWPLNDKRRGPGSSDRTGHIALEPARHRLGINTVMVGVLEATEVQDRWISIALQPDGDVDRIDLTFSGDLADAVYAGLCRRVTIRGRLRNDPRSGRSVLHLHNLEVVQDHLTSDTSTDGAGDLRQEPRRRADEYAGGAK